MKKLLLLILILILSACGDFDIYNADGSVSSDVVMRTNGIIPVPVYDFVYVWHGDMVFGRKMVGPEDRSTVLLCWIKPFQKYSPDDDILNDGYLFVATNECMGWVRVR